MKKINILWMLIGCLFLVTSCSDDDDSSAVASLQVIKSDVSFTAIAIHNDSPKECLLSKNISNKIISAATIIYPSICFKTVIHSIKHC